MVSIIKEGIWLARQAVKVAVHLSTLSGPSNPWDPDWDETLAYLEEQAR